MCQRSCICRRFVALMQDRPAIDHCSDDGGRCVRFRDERDGAPSRRPRRAQHQRHLAGIDLAYESDRHVQRVAEAQVAMAVDHGGVGAERGEAGGVGVDVEAVRMAFDDLQPAFERGEVEQAAELAEAAADAGCDFAADERAPGAMRVRCSASAARRRLWRLASAVGVSWITWVQAWRCGKACGVSTRAKRTSLRNRSRACMRACSCRARGVSGNARNSRRSIVSCAAVRSTGKTPAVAADDRVRDRALRTAGASARGRDAAAASAGRRSCRA